MSKTVEFRVSVSTNPATAHIGRYFVDVRDTTHGGEGRQLVTYTADLPKLRSIFDLMSQAAQDNGVTLVKVDNTGENVFGE